MSSGPTLPGPPGPNLPGPPVSYARMPATPAGSAAPAPVAAPASSSSGGGMGAMLTTRTAMIAGCVAASAGLVWYGVHRWSTNRAHRARIGTSDVFSIALPDAKMTKYSVRRRGSKGACTEEYAGMHKIWCIIHVLHANSGSFPREDAVYSEMRTLCDRAFLPEHDHLAGVQRQ